MMYCCSVPASLISTSAWSIFAEFRFWKILWILVLHMYGMFLSFRKKYRVPFLDCGFLFAVLRVCADKLSTLFVFPFRSDCTFWFTVGSGGAEHPCNTVRIIRFSCNSLNCYGIQTVEIEAAYWTYAWFSCVFHTAWQIDFGSWVVHWGAWLVCTSTGQLLSHVIVCWE